MGPRALETLDISRVIHKLCSDLKKCSQMIFEFLIPELAVNSSRGKMFSDNALLSFTSENIWPIFITMIANDW